MTLKDFLDKMNSGEEIEGGSVYHLYMHALSQEALRITMENNGRYHTPEELNALMRELTAHPDMPDVGLFPPFYTDCGKNIHLGENVFINSGCRFQDQGGIYIGDGALIGHNAVLATLNHDMDPAKRANLIPAPIRIGRNAWLGANVTVLPGVTIGDGAVIAAGAVVTRDVPPDTVAAGVPARVIRKVK
jgi:acetyltransferase-like isoleucine patch superfamily enzyme